MFEQVWYLSIEKEQKTIKAQLTSIKKQRNDINAAIQQRNLELIGATKTSKSVQYKLLQQRERELDENLASYAQLVSPSQMPDLLKNFFDKSKGLELIKLNKKPVKPAFTSDQLATKSNSIVYQEDKNIQFYRHDFTVKLSGGYFDLMKSLQELEKLNLKIYWESLNYQVMRYPNADITLTVYTYSYEKNWIGA
ncbi:MAG: hypothetical protein HWE13_04150 [Gammaproteobacteria bacterium]|nr:hypothetical protein [Gammaproteobacteria bacterium]NVK87289.1 hypothetical protein [Gammaproteobacteria bacterium]